MTQQTLNNYYTKEEIRQAKRMAYRHVSFYAGMIRFVRPFKYDGRTRIGNLANSIVQELKSNSSFIEQVKKTKKRRKENKPYEFSNILDNPIVRDWKANKRRLTVYDNRLSDGYRNHWAKNEKDLQILKILRQNYSVS